MARDFIERMEAGKAPAMDRRNRGHHTGFMCGRTTPQPGKFLERSQPKKCLAQEHGIKINHYAHASYYKPQIIAGVPVYGTDYTSSYA